MKRNQNQKKKTILGPIELISVVIKVLFLTPGSALWTKEMKKEKMPAIKILEGIDRWHSLFSDVLSL